MFLCLVFLMLSRLFITAWERAVLMPLFGNVIVFLLLSHVVARVVWYLIVSFPDLCRLSYFVCRAIRQKLRKLT